MFHRTERLMLRPAWPEDWEMILWGIGDERVVRNLAKAPWPYLPEHAREFAARGQDPRHPAFLLTLPEEQGSRLVGCAGLGEIEGGTEIGYWIAQPYWNRGFATEGARGCSAIAGWRGVISSTTLPRVRFCASSASYRQAKPACSSRRGEARPPPRCSTRST